ncbi:hypothetical protein GJAV_G00070380 [Gymnothorax javanicus]|nr:hypothetical protein GJAV_G00070380 [Gymnothorax javanicus]
MAEVKSTLICAAVLFSSAVFAFVEDLDDTFKDNRMDDVWLVDFYAPWCGFCKKLEPVWQEVGAELKNSGSHVRVGKIDATAYSGIASEFGVRGYPTIKLLKGDLNYSYKGARTKDGIIDFANRVSGPAVRSLPSKQMFEHVMKRHNVLFVYVGGDSPLKEKYMQVASELIVYTYFFAASADVLPEEITIPELPAVVVFKDGTYFTYDEYQEASLSTWISKERFLRYLQVDAFVLYELGETGKLVAMAVVDEKNLTEESIRLKTLVQTAATEHKDQFSRDFQFGHTDGNEFINSLVMGEVELPSFIILNTSNEQYFLHSGTLETMDELLLFINNVLEGTVQAQGGDSILQRFKRLAYDAKSTVVSVFQASMLLGCVMFGLPIGVISLMCYGICSAQSYDGADDLDLKRDGLTDEEEDDDGQRRPLELESPREEQREGEQEEKSAEDKKVD